MKFKKSNYLLKNITEMKNLGNLSEKQAGIVFTMHVNGDLGCFKVEQNIKKSNKDITTGIYCGDEPKNWTKKQINEKFDDYKVRIQNQYKNNETQLMCATKSFGMGINKPFRMVDDFLIEYITGSHLQWKRYIKSRDERVEMGKQQKILFYLLMKKTKYPKKYLTLKQI